MVVEVVTEGLDVRDVFVAALGSQVTGEKDCIISNARYFTEVDFGR